MAVRQPSVNAGRRPPPSAADGVDRGPPNSRLHLIEKWPGAAGQARQNSCQIFCHRRIYADSRRHRQEEAEAAKTQWRKVADQLRPKLPKLAAFMAWAV